MTQKQLCAASPTDTGELLAEQLLRRLRASTTPEDYLEEAPIDNRTLSQYLNELLVTHGKTRSDVVRSSAVSATFAYQVFGGSRQMGRENALKLALGMGCTLHETQLLLHHTGVSGLWCKNRRDAIIIYCIEHGYTLMRCDEELYRLGEATLVPQ